MLRLRLLGDVIVERDGQVVRAFQSLPLQSLVAQLVLHRDAPQPRERLAYLLWPDSTDQQARSNLRKLLHTLRRALPEADECLDITHRALQWRPDAAADIDLVTFEDALAAADEVDDAAAMRGELERAVAAYGGPLLPTCYHDWVLAERERLHHRAVAALERLVAVTGETDDGAALQHADALLRLDPLREASYRHLMRLLARRGERAEALRVYHTCESVLERELGLEPSDPTRHLRQELLDRAAGPVAETPSRTARTAPMIGRDAEWKRLHGTWEEATTCHGVVISGEAGIGKTRLLEELARAASSDGAVIAWTRAYEAEGRLAWGAVIDWLESDPIRGRVDALEPVWQAELVRLLPDLRRTHPDLPDPVGLEHAAQRPQLFRAVVEALSGLDGPVLLVVDDLQWCDDDTLAFLHYLLRQAPARHLLVAGTARTDAAFEDRVRPLLDSLGRDGHATQLRLDPLDEAATLELAEQVAGHGLSDEVRRRLYEETRGNPYFVVEAVRSGSSTGQAAAATVLESVLQLRLRELSPEAHAVVEAAAVVGRAFSVDLLAAMGVVDEDALLAALDELWRRRIVREQHAAYDFDHDRLREVAYAMISPARRTGLHRAAAQALEQVHVGHLGPTSSRLAVHYEQAGLLWQAAVARRTAVDHALHVLALDVAELEVERGLSLLEQLPAGRDRDQLELELRMAQAVPIVIRRGYGDPEVARTYERAWLLSRQLGLPPPPPVLRGLALAAVVSCRFDRARELGEHLLASGQEPNELGEGHYVLGVCAHWRGDFTAARDHLDRALERVRAEPRPRHVARFAQDPELVCRCRLAWSQWYLGDAVDAVAGMRESLELADRLDHPLTSAYVFWIAATLALEVGDADWLRTLHRDGAARWEVNPVFADVYTPLFRGWIRRLDGDRDGSADLEVAAEASRPDTHALSHTYALGLLARAHLADSRPDEAAAVLEAALARTEQRGQHYLAAELHRMTGEAAIQLGDVTAAERAFDRALRTATAQRAKAYQLRAATSLVRHCPSEAALGRLRSVHATVEAGGTADGRAAAQLLAAAT